MEPSRAKGLSRSYIPKQNDASKSRQAAHVSMSTHEPQTFSQKQSLPTRANSSSTSLSHALIGQRKLPSAHQSLFDLSKVQDKSLFHPTQNRIADFYLGHCPYNAKTGWVKGVLQNDILSSKTKLSTNSEKFNLLFPLHTASREGFPVADLETRLLFRQNSALRKSQRIIASPLLMQFGIKFDDEYNVSAINPTSLLNQAWLTPDQDIRALKDALALQTVVKSLFLLENKKLAVNLLQFMSDKYREKSPGSKVNISRLLADLPSIAQLQGRMFDDEPAPIIFPKQDIQYFYTTKDKLIPLTKEQERIKSCWQAFVDVNLVSSLFEVKKNQDSIELVQPTKVTWFTDKIFENIKKTKTLKEFKGLCRRQGLLPDHEEKQQLSSARRGESIEWWNILVRELDVPKLKKVKGEWCIDLDDKELASEWDLFLKEYSELEIDQRRQWIIAQQINKKWPGKTQDKLLESTDLYPKIKQRVILSDNDLITNTQASQFNLISNYCDRLNIYFLYIPNQLFKTIKEIAAQSNETLETFFMNLHVAGMLPTPKELKKYSKKEELIELIQNNKLDDWWSLAMNNGAPKLCPDETGKLNVSENKEVWQKFFIILAANDIEYHQQIIDYWKKKKEWPAEEKFIKQKPKTSAKLMPTIEFKLRFTPEYANDIEKILQQSTKANQEEKWNFYCESVGIDKEELEQELDTGTFNEIDKWTSHSGHELEYFSSNLRKYGLLPSKKEQITNTKDQLIKLIKAHNCTDWWSAALKNNAPKLLRLENFYYVESEKEAWIDICYKLSTIDPKYHQAIIDYWKEKGKWPEWPE